MTRRQLLYVLKQASRLLAFAFFTGWMVAAFMILLLVPSMEELDPSGSSKFLLWTWILSSPFFAYALFIEYAKTVYKKRMISGLFGFRIGTKTEVLSANGKDANTIALLLADDEIELNFYMDKSFALTLARALLDNVARHNVTDFGTDVADQPQIPSLPDLVNKLKSNGDI